MPEPKVIEKKVDELIPDVNNANRGSERGEAMLNESLKRHGAARSIVLDKEGRIIAGNKTVQQAKRVGVTDVIVVETDGTALVAVQRTDLDLENGGAARALAYEDNRTSEVSLDWNPEQILSDLDEGLDFGNLFSDDELSEIEEEALLSRELATSLVGGSISNIRAMGDKKKQIKPVLYVDEVSVFEAAIKAVGVKNRGQALITICKAYIERAEGQLDF